MKLFDTQSFFCRSKKRERQRHLQLERLERSERRKQKKIVEELLSQEQEATNDVTSQTGLRNLTNAFLAQYGIGVIVAAMK